MKNDTNNAEVTFHPIQRDRCLRELPTVVTLKAYEVYCELYGSQPALIEGWCRGGFGILELVGYLYASSFPRNEWKQRFEEAIFQKEAR